MRTMLLSLIGVALFVAVAAAADEPKAKKQKLEVAFGVPNPTYKATISEVRQVGKELWARVDMSGGDGIAPAVIGKVKDSVEIDPSELPVKYLVFGKKWGWKNEEEGIVFLKDKEEEERTKLEKAFGEGKVVFTAKKEEPKKDPPKK